MARMTFRGKERFLRQLKRLGPELIGDLKPVLEKNAKELADAIRRDVPKLSGDLEDTVDEYEVRESSGQAWRVVEGASRDTDEKGFYGTWQEFGWAGHLGRPHFFFHVRRLRSKFRARLSRAAKRSITRNFRNGR